MDKVAIKGASLNLDKAIAAEHAMEGAKTLAEFETAWSHFLTASHRIFSKLEQGAKTNGKSKAWFGRKKHERKTDPLLRYMHHARNADEHGLVQITERTASALALGVGPGSWQFDGILGPGGHMKVTALGRQIPGISKFAEFTPSKVRLAKVVDSGVTYEPPLGEDSKEIEPVEAAKLALGHLQRIIEEARELAD